MNQATDEMKSTENKREAGESYNFSDQELIRQLAKSRMAQGRQLEYEDLSGYELPPRTHFSFLSKPAVSIKYGKITFNMACIHMFEDAMFVVTPVNREKKRLMVIPCGEEESASLQWARVKKNDGIKVNKTISSDEFVSKLYRLMEWDLNCRYKILGRISIARPGDIPVLVFDLEEAIMFDSKPVEIVNEDTGEIIKKHVKYYPSAYKDCFGKSYSDYIAARQMNMFEFLDEYSGQTYDDLKNAQADGEIGAENVTADSGGDTG